VGLSLSAALRAGEARAAAGPAAVLAAAHEVLAAQPALAVDYLELVDPGPFTAVPPDYAGPAVLAVAARAGTTRLIDNVPLLLANEGQDR
jgi:pantoate--beta-alanine ligase